MRQQLLAGAFVLAGSFLVDAATLTEPTTCNMGRRRRVTQWLVSRPGPDLCGLPAIGICAAATGPGWEAAGCVRLARTPFGWLRNGAGKAAGGASTRAAGGSNICAVRFHTPPDLLTR